MHCFKWFIIRDLNISTPKVVQKKKVKNIYTFIPSGNDD